MSPALASRAQGLLRPLLALTSLAQLAPLYGFARLASERQASGLLQITGVSMVLAALGAWAAWSRRAWTGWPTLLSASWTATAGFWGISAAGRSSWWWVVLLAGLVLLLGVLSPAPAVPRITWPIRIFCVAVAALTRYVAFWGLLFPAGIPRSSVLGIDLTGLAKGFDDAMPFVPAIPPLHARFIGALYLGATVICLWHVCARSWAVARLLQALIFLWTLILLVVSVRHPAAFDWESSSVWLWWLAYLAFPAISLWIFRRIEPEPDPDDSPLPTWGRVWLYAQGTGLLGLSLLGFVAVPLLIDIWPWKLGELLGHVYSAPFAAFGIGSCLAARSRGARRRALIPFCAATFAMAAGSFVASLIHRDRFVADAPSTWVWFGVLSAVALASAALAAQVLVHVRAAARRPRSFGAHPGVDPS